MSRRIRFLCVLLLAATVFAALQAREALPFPRRNLVAAKYAGWSGVLRLWVCEDLPGASPMGWLNACVSIFERAHPGVYVQAQVVDAGAMRALAESGINPPDLVLFPPGLFANGENFLPLHIEATLRGPLAAAGLWRGETRAVPVALGAYAWACDRARLPEPPISWAEAGVSPALPADEPYRCWSAAALALCSGLDSPGTPEPALPGVDLGLPEVPAPTPSPTTRRPTEGVPCALPPGTGRTEDAFAAFVSGDRPALAATLPDLRRLERLAEAGRGPDWQAAMPGEYALADQLAMLAVVDWPRRSGAERAALARAFAAHLLTEPCQADLAQAQAFPVVAGVTAHARGTLARLEAALAEKRLLAPNAFDGEWRALAARGMEDFLAGIRTAREVLAALAAHLEEKANIPGEDSPRSFRHSNHNVYI